MKLPDFFQTDREEVDQALERLLPPSDTPPPVIHQALRYSVFAGGKRIRPILCIETARVFSRCETARDEEGSPEPAVRQTASPQAGAVIAGCAIEFIHTYSLVHDDLPALDNDDLRRGKPTCHKKFGEANAILAGDALLTLAFQTLAEAPVEPVRRLEMIREVAVAAGTVNGMVGGQVADLEAEGKPVTAAGLEYIHKSKTAALIRASVVAGALSAGATPDDVARMRRFGETIGWAFQVVDDILDVEESSAALGKTAGKDATQKKATYPALYGLERSHAFAQELCEQAMAELQPYGERAARLRQIAEFLIQRRA